MQKFRKLQSVSFINQKELVDDVVRTLDEDSLFNMNSPDSKNIKTRGGNAGEINLIKDPINLILIWGCRPAKGVLANTKMCSDLKQLFNDRFDR